VAKASRIAALGDRASSPWSSSYVLRVFQESSKVNSKRWMAESRTNSSLGWAKAEAKRATARRKRATCSLSFSSFPKENPLSFHLFPETRSPGEFHQVHPLQDGELFQLLPDLA
jgi:hypothetical protein